MDIGPAESALRGSAVQCQPVPKLESEIPEIFFSTGLILPAHTVHPFPHQRIVPPQCIGIPISGVESFWQKGSNIAPDCGGQPGKFVGQVNGNLSVIPFLVKAQVSAEFVVKCPGIHKPTGGRAEYHGIAAPAKPLIPLGTVHGHIHKIGFQTPQGVFVETVDFFVSGGKITRLFHFGVDCPPQKQRGVDVCKAADLYIAETKKGKMGTDGPHPAIGDVSKH